MSAYLEAVLLKSYLPVCTGNVNKIVSFQVRYFFLEKILITILLITYLF